MIIQTAKALAERNHADFYPTDPRVAAAQVRLLPFSGDSSPFILDPGAGEGVYGQAARARYPGAVIAGTDMRPLSRPAGYDYWQTGGHDFTRTRPTRVFDAVIGNPPFGKDALDRRDELIVERFIRIGMSLLVPGGVLIYLLRLAYLASQARGSGLFRQMPPKQVVVLSKRPSFIESGKTDSTDYAFFCFEEGFTGKSALDWINIAEKTVQMPLFSYPDEYSAASLII